MKLTASQIYEMTAAFLVAIAAGLVGGFALLKRMSLASDVVSHLALPGIGIALVFKLNPLLGAASTLLIGTLLVWGIEKKTGIATEAAIGVVFAASLAAGALITPKEELEEALFGQLQPLNLVGFLIASTAALAIVAVVLARKERLTLALFSPDLAAASGVNVSRISLEFLLLFSLTILVCLKFLGALLAGALLMIPAATGRRVATGINSFLMRSVLASIAAVVAGLLISTKLPASVSEGPIIVLVAAAGFVAVTLMARGQQ
ncbi:MAG: metal ABC transporter permease [Acidobacteriia bacterium]|nr:metal ABC transporter permease [Terriglobia bacterium]